VTNIEPKVLDSVNRAGRVGVLATVDAKGQPNAAYFGSPRLQADGTLVMGLGANRSLANLEQNPQAVFFTVEQAPVGMGTPGWRLYLQARDIQRQGPVLDAVREAIAKAAGPQAAQMIQAGVVFTVTEVRPLLAMA
jgi:predicted pyridoxine 5'-phosphate oxidase superfamily flavin-nucleotide-binding protein